MTKFSENEFVGKCKEISEEIAGRLNEMDIDAIPMRIIDGEDTKYNSPVFNHSYTFLPKTPYRMLSQTVIESDLSDHNILVTTFDLW